MLKPLTNLIIYGNCPKCGHYLINKMDDFTASLGALNIGCSHCGYIAINEETKIRELIHIYGLTALKWKGKNDS